MKRYLLGNIVALSACIFAFNTSATETPSCSEVLSCAQLGYNQTASTIGDCEKIIACPFDVKYKKCLDCGSSAQCELEGYVLNDGTCENKTVCPYNSAYISCSDPICNIGDIYYEDGTCTDRNNVNAKVTPIGVVFMLTDKSGNIVSGPATHGRIVSLKDLTADAKYTYSSDGTNTTLVWSQSSSSVVTGTAISSCDELLTGIQSAKGKEGSSILYDGKSLTKKIYSTLSSETTAAKTAYTYYPEYATATKFGPGNWYLPAIGEMIQLYGGDIDSLAGCTADGMTGETKLAVNKTLQVLADINSSFAEIISQTYYWTATEYNEQAIWYLKMTSGARFYNGKYPRQASVRAVLAF